MDTPTPPDLDTQIHAKRAQIVDYERILANYWGRWNQLGRRNLAQLKQELADLESQKSP